MRVPHGGMVMVADGAKMLFFRNDGEADRLDLVVEAASEQADQPHRDQAEDVAGRAPGGGTMGGADYHRQAEERFAADAAALLNRRAENGSLKSVVVVASPRTLGEMRKHYRPALTGKLAGELAKDLTGHPADRIAALLEQAG